MDFIELVKRRFSVRSYDARPVRREDIAECLEAARLAPSACNSQPWQFIVVDSEPLKKSLSEAMLKRPYGMNGFIKDAPVIVVVVTEGAAWFAKVCNAARDTKMYLIDIGMACEHFALRAAELGIGTCFLGWFNEKAAKRALGIPAMKRLHIAISMGYPREGRGWRDKERKALDRMSRFEEALPEKGGKR